MVDLHNKSMLEDRFDDLIMTAAATPAECIERAAIRDLFKYGSLKVGDVRRLAAQYFGLTNTGGCLTEYPEGIFDTLVDIPASQAWRNILKLTLGQSIPKPRCFPGDPSGDPDDYLAWKLTEGKTMALYIYMVTFHIGQLIRRGILPASLVRNCLSQELKE